MQLELYKTSVNKSKKTYYLTCQLDVAAEVQKQSYAVQHAPPQVLVGKTNTHATRTHMQLNEGVTLPDRDTLRGLPPTEGLLCNTGSLLLLLLGTATVFSFSPPTCIIDTCCLSTEYI